MPILTFSNFPEATKRIVDTFWFQRLIILTILIAGVLAGIETDAGMMSTHGPTLRALDGIVLGMFIVEAILKITARCPRPWGYFRDGWNVFDFTVIVVCLLPMDSQFAVVLRLGRTLRLLRLVSALPKLQLLVGALIKSFSSMGYVGLLLGIMFYIYAIAGVHLFGGHDKEHFGSLSRAFLTLFQTITLDDWKFLFASAQGTAPTVAAVYFISFILLGTMIMLNLFIGTRRGSGVDNLAHVGGFACGALVGLLVAPEAGRREGEGDGALLPPWCVRGLLAATIVLYLAGLSQATRIALTLMRVYGRK